MKQGGGGGGGGGGGEVMGPHKKLTHTLRTTKQSLLQTTNVNVVHDPHDLVTHDHIPPLSGEEKELENNNQII